MKKSIFVLMLALTTWFSSAVQAAYNNNACVQATGSLELKFRYFEGVADTFEVKINNQVLAKDNAVKGGTRITYIFNNIDTSLPITIEKTSERRPRITVVTLDGEKINRKYFNLKNTRYIAGGKLMNAKHFARYQKNNPEQASKTAIPNCTPDPVIPQYTAPLHVFDNVKLADVELLPPNQTHLLDSLSWHSDVTEQGGNTRTTILTTNLSSPDQLEGKHLFSLAIIGEDNAGYAIFVDPKTGAILDKIETQGSANQDQTTANPQIATIDLKEGEEIVVQIVVTGTKPNFELTLTEPGSDTDHVVTHHYFATPSDHYNQIVLFDIPKDDTPSELAELSKIFTGKVQNNDALDPRGPLVYYTHNGGDNKNMGLRVHDAEYRLSPETGFMFDIETAENLNPNSQVNPNHMHPVSATHRIDAKINVTVNAGCHTFTLDNLKSKLRKGDLIISDQDSGEILGTSNTKTYGRQPASAQVCTDSGQSLVFELVNIQAGKPSFQVLMQSENDLEPRVIPYSSLSQPARHYHTDIMVLRDQYKNTITALRDELTPYFDPEYAALVYSTQNETADDLLKNAANVFAQAVEPTLLNNPHLMQQLVKYVVMSKIGIDRLARFAGTSTAQQQMLETFLDNNALMNDMVTLGEAATDDNYVAAMYIFNTLEKHFNAYYHQAFYDNPLAYRLALAISLGYANAQDLATLVDRFDYYMTNKRQGWLYPGFETLDVFELQLVIQNDIPISELEWARDMFFTMYPQNTNVDANTTWSNTNAIIWMGGLVRTGRPHFDEDCLNPAHCYIRHGAQCGGKAYTGRAFASALGVPHARRPQRKHASNVSLSLTHSLGSDAQMQVINRGWMKSYTLGPEGDWGAGAEVAYYGNKIPDEKFRALVTARESGQFKTQVQTMRLLATLFSQEQPNYFKNFLKSRNETELQQEIANMHEFGRYQDNSIILRAVGDTIDQLASTISFPLVRNIDTQYAQTVLSTGTYEAGDALDISWAPSKIVDNLGWDGQSLQRKIHPSVFIYPASHTFTAYTLSGEYVSLAQNARIQVNTDAKAGLSSFEVNLGKNTGGTSWNQFASTLVLPPNSGKNKVTLSQLEKHPLQIRNVKLTPVKASVEPIQMITWQYTKAIDPNAPWGYATLTGVDREDLLNNKPPLRSREVGSLGAQVPAKSCNRGSIALFRGQFIAPETGNYRFTIAQNKNAPEAQLFLESAQASFDLVVDTRGIKESNAVYLQAGERRGVDLLTVCASPKGLKASGQFKLDAEGQHWQNINAIVTSQ